jgi:hypothetical protein
MVRQDPPLTPLEKEPYASATDKQHSSWTTVNQMELICRMLPPDNDMSARGNKTVRH